MIHARPDYNRIQDPAGLIPEDMPVFLLLGKDKHAAKTVRFWADQVEADGGDPEIIRMARAHADLMDALPDHKQPDLKLAAPVYLWECNECGSQEYTMSVSEDDVNRLGCGNCGGDEWHKALKK